MFGAVRSNSGTRTWSVRIATVGSSLNLEMFDAATAQRVHDHALCIDAETSSLVTPVKARAAGSYPTLPKSRGSPSRSAFTLTAAPHCGAPGAWFSSRNCPARTK